MKPYTKKYMDFFGFKIPEDAICEIPGCGLPANDIHHIQSRGMGGDPKGEKDYITNLMAVCRKHHEEYGDVPEVRTWLHNTRLRFIHDKGLNNKLKNL